MSATVTIPAKGSPMVTRESMGDTSTLFVQGEKYEYLNNQALITLKGTGPSKALYDN